MAVFVTRDRKEAACWFLLMRIEQRQLLMTMRDIAGIIDIERDGFAAARRDWRR